MMMNNTQLYKNEAGQIIIIMAFLMIAMIAMLGLAVDGGGLMFLQRDVQNASDAAIVAATYARCSGGNDAQVIHAARDAAKAQGFEHGVDGVTVNVEPNYTGTTSTAKYIQVTINSPKDAYFIQIVYKDPLSVTSESVGRCTPVQVVGGGGNSTTLTDVGVYAGAGPGCLAFDMDAQHLNFNRTLISLGDVDIHEFPNDYAVDSFIVGGTYNDNGSWRNQNINGGGGQPHSNMDTSGVAGVPNLYDINTFDSTHASFAYGSDSRYVNLDNVSGATTLDKIVNSGAGMLQGGGRNLVVQNGGAGAIFYSANPIIIIDPNLQIIANNATWVSRDAIVIDINRSNLNRANGDLPLFFSDLGNEDPGCTEVTGPTGIDVTMSGGSMKGPFYTPKSHLHFYADDNVTFNSCLIGNTVEISGNHWNQSGGCDIILGGDSAIIPPTIGIAE